MLDQPQNPLEKLLYDHAYDRWRGHGLWISILGLLPVLWPFWDQLVELLTIEVVAGFVSIAQLGLLMVVPDRLAASMAKRELLLARRNGTIPHWEPPIRSETTVLPWLKGRRYDLRAGFILYLDDTRRRAWAKTVGQGAPVLAEQADVDRYFQVLGLVLDDRRYLGWATAMVVELQILLAKVILNHSRESAFFRDWPVEVIADRLHTYCRDHASRNSE